MDQELNNGKRPELDRLKDLRLSVNDPRRSSLVIYGGDGAITLHSENGAESNEGLYAVMIKALREEINRRIEKLEA